MRSSLSPLAATIVVGLLVAACAPASSPVPVLTAPRSVASSAPRPIPTATPQASGSSITAIAAGYFHTCVLTSEGGVKCWGANDAGQLGNATTTSSRAPIDVAGLASGVSAVAAGAGHTCALIRSGGVKCWGWNGAGQLGDRSTTDSSVPVDVSGLECGVITVAPGDDHTYALTSGGGVKCWGSSYIDEGTGAMIGSNVPVDVAGLATGISSIAVGQSHTCALTSDGGVKCWGSNDRGQLGNGIRTYSSIPVDVPVDVAGLASGIAAISAGGGHTCALTSSGGVTCWGWNQWGQLGDGTQTSRRVPVTVDFANP